MEERIDQLEQSMRTLAAYVKEEMDRMKSGVVIQSDNSYINRLEEMEKLLAKMQTQAPKQVMQQKIDVVSDREKEEADIEISSLEKNVTDLKLKVKDIEIRIQKLTATKTTDDARIERIVRRELGEFSKVLDRKFPNIATRDEMFRIKSDIERNMSLIETPDMSFVERKIEFLEQKLAEVTVLVRDVYNKLPAILE